MEFSDESDPEAHPQVEVKEKALVSKRRPSSKRAASVPKPSTCREGPLPGGPPGARKARADPVLQLLWGRGGCGGPCCHSPSQEGQAQETLKSVKWDTAPLPFCLPASINSSTALLLQRHYHTCCISSIFGLLWTDSWQMNINKTTLTKHLKPLETKCTCTALY